MTPQEHYLAAEGLLEKAEEANKPEWAQAFSAQAMAHIKAAEIALYWPTKISGHPVESSSVDER